MFMWVRMAFRAQGRRTSVHDVGGDQRGTLWRDGGEHGCGVRKRGGDEGRWQQRPSGWSRRGPNWDGRVRGDVTGPVRIIGACATHGPLRDRQFQFLWSASADACHWAKASGDSGALDQADPSTLRSSGSVGPPLQGRHLGPGLPRPVGPYAGGTGR